MPTILRPGGSIPTATKPLLRRSTLKRQHDELSDRSSPAAVKRAKVTFNDKVEVKDVQGREKAPEHIQEEVRQALRMHAIGDDSGYDKIKNIYSAGKQEEVECSSYTLKNYTTALLSNVASLNKSCSGLIAAVLESKWVNQTDDYLAVYVRFLGNLVSAQGSFLPDVLAELVQMMVPTKIWKTRLHDSALSQAEIRSRLNSALRYLLRLIPSASHTLSSILHKEFPSQRDSKHVHNNYVQNLLKVVTYAPELRGDILALITDRLVKIDVQVQVDIDELADDIGEDLVQSLPQIRNKLVEDLDEPDQSDDESDFSEESENEDEDEEVQRKKDLLHDVGKMDSMLDLLFRYYDQEFSAASITTRRSALDTLLSQFMTIILPMSRSRHTQFLLFHFVQTDPEFVDTFLGTSAALAFDQGQSSIIRQAAAAYLASFVARGAQVSAVIVRDIFDCVAVELDRLRKQYEPGCKGPDPHRYTSYYSLVQTLLYIFCFRWRDLEYDPNLESEDEDFPTAYEVEHRWRPGVKEALVLNIFSTHLNPLKICNPEIVNQFAEISNHLGIVYVYGLLETNKRIRLSRYAGSYRQMGRETALSARKDESHYHLEGYFPFDPYTLPLSKKWIEGDYLAWIGPSGMRDEAGDGSESEEDDVAESDLDDDTATDASKDSL